jgi:hypothetical protein
LKQELDAAKEQLHHVSSKSRETMESKDAELHAAQVLAGKGQV